MVWGEPPHGTLFLRLDFKSTIFFFVATKRNRLFYTKNTRSVIVFLHQISPSFSFFFFVFPLLSVMGDDAHLHGDSGYDDFDHQEHHALSLPGMLQIVLGVEGARDVMAWVHAEPVLAVLGVMVLFMIPMVLSCCLSYTVGGDSPGLLGPVVSARDRLQFSTNPKAVELARHLDLLLSSLLANAPSPEARPNIAALSSACERHDLHAIERSLRPFGIHLDGKV